MTDFWFRVDVACTLSDGSVQNIREMEISVLSTSLFLAGRNLKSVVFGTLQESGSDRFPLPLESVVIEYVEVL